MSSNSSCETTKTGMSNPNRLFIMDLISFESLSLSSMSAQKTTLPLLRYVETAVYPSSAKPAFNSDIAILFLPLILIPLNKATTSYFMRVDWETVGRCVNRALHDLEPEIRGTFLAAIGFEVIKIVMTYTLPSLMKSPSGAAFGSVLGLMAFFYFFARLTLFCAAWIATAEYKDDPRMPGKTQP